MSVRGNGLSQHRDWRIDPELGREVKAINMDHLEPQGYDCKNCVFNGKENDKLCESHECYHAIWVDRPGYARLRLLGLMEQP